MCAIRLLQTSLTIYEWYMKFLYDISKTVCAIYVICGIVIAHGPKMCPIVFGSDVMHINEEAGLKVKS